MTSAEPTYTIGAVLAQLREEFPDLTLSKVRFLDGQGVVSPKRAGSGYRRYSDADIDRLRFVLRAQRDKFWPLKVIREALDAYDRGLAPALDDERPTAPAAHEDELLPSVGDIAAARPQVRLTAAELAKACEIEESGVGELEDFGIVKADTDGYYDSADLDAARAAAALMAYGVGARHLRPFRLAADREVALVDQMRFTSRDVDAETLLRECLALHLAMVRARLHAD